ncbi:MAG: hypothetical protein V4643_00150 [Bacteroidota bacterium]
MKTLYPLISLFLLFHLFSSCSTDCPDSGTQTNYVDQAYLPDIIPYSNTSIRRFLRNGKDTLVFYSQSLKETFESGSTLSGDCPKNYKNQQFSLKMVASDTDFFEMRYYAIKTGGVARVKINTSNYWSSDEGSYIGFNHYYPPVLSITVNNTFYDTITILKNELDSVYLKPKVGVLKIKTDKVTYELIP